MLEVFFACGYEGEKFLGGVFLSLLPLFKSGGVVEKNFNFLLVLYRDKQN
ncbi:MAG: hypothetical protein QXI12_05275 [Candidatus Methanomethyliaceae archaeon]